jgi:nucleotide-binding universal stress UspA family protein
MPLPRKILVPVDFAPCAQAALDQAAELAGALAASLTVLHVEPSETAKTASALESHDAAVRALGEYVERARGVIGERAQGLLRTGDPDRVIREHAVDGGFDLIAMGTHGRSGRLHMLTGSVAESVLRNAPCPVLIVRMPS